MEHSCLEPWGDQVDEKFEDIRVSPAEMENGYKKVFNLLNVPYHEIITDEEKMKEVIKMNVIPEDFESLFFEALE